MGATYPAIEAHGLIGDLQTAALISADGAVDWFCAPRFDSPSVFGALLDHDKGGLFRLTPDGVDYTSKQLYLPGTRLRKTSPSGCTSSSRPVSRSATSRRRSVISR